MFSFRCLLVLAVCALCGCAPSREATQTTDVPKAQYLSDIGAEGRLVGLELEQGGKSQFVLLATSHEAFDEYIKANVAQDKTKLQELVSSGRLYSVATGLVKAKKIDSEAFSVEVRILSGEHKDEAPWTNMECLQK